MRNREALHRRNYIAMIIEGALFMGGVGFFSNSTVIPVFIDRFTGSKPLLGLALTIFTLAMLTPRLLIGPHVPFIRNHSGYIMRVVSIGRPLSLVPALLLLTGHPGAAVPAVIVCVSLVWMANGSIMLVWSELLANTVSSAWHGRLLGLQVMFGGFASIGAGAMVRLLLGNPDIPKETAFGWIFLLGGILVTLSAVAMGFVHEGPHEPKQGRPSYREYFGGLPGVIREERDNMRVLILQLIMTIAMMCLPFAILFSSDRLGFSSTTTATLILVQSVGAPLGGWMWGQICDRLGSLTGLRLAATGTILVSVLPLLALAFGAASLPIMVAFMVIGGICGSLWTAQFVYTMQVVRPRNRSANIVMLSILMLPASFANTIAGQIAGRFGFVPLFAVCAVIALSGLLLSLTVRHPDVVRRERAELGESEETSKNVVDKVASQA